MLVMKYKTITVSTFGNPAQRAIQLRDAVLDFIARIGAQSVVSICEHPELSMIAVWYREEG